MDRQGSGEKMENKVVVEKKIKVGMCRRFAKRKGGSFPSALLHGDRLSTDAQEVRSRNQGFNENVNPRACIRSSGFCNLIRRWIHSAFDNIFLPETIVCLMKSELRAIKLFHRRK